MKTKLLGTAPTKTDLELLVNEFFYSTNYKINDDNKLENEKLSEEKLNNINKRIIIKFSKNRWRFEMIING